MCECVYGYVCVCVCECMCVACVSIDLQLWVSQSDRQRLALTFAFFLFRSKIPLYLNLLSPDKNTYSEKLYTHSRTHSVLEHCSLSVSSTRMHTHTLALKHTHTLAWLLRVLARFYSPLWHDSNSSDQYIPFSHSLSTSERKHALTHTHARTGTCTHSHAPSLSLLPSLCSALAFAHRHSKSLSPTQKLLFPHPCFPHHLPFNKNGNKKLRKDFFGCKKTFWEHFFSPFRPNQDNFLWLYSAR